MDEQRIADRISKEVISAKGPFSQMDNRELKKWIEFYAEMAPENFHMDGEYGGSYSSRVRDLMKKFRRWPLSMQQMQYDDLQKWAKMTGTRIARELTAGSGVATRLDSGVDDE